MWNVLLFASRDALSLFVEKWSMVVEYDDWNNGTMDVILWTCCLGLIVLTLFLKIQYYDHHREQHQQQQQQRGVELKHLEYRPKPPTIRVLFRPDDTNGNNSTTTSSSDGSTCDGSSRVEDKSSSSSSSSHGNNNWMDVLLPDSFAPLLSSSIMNIQQEEFEYADLVHALQMRGSICLKKNEEFEIPLDVSHQKPQFTLCPSSSNTSTSSNTSGTKLSFSCSLGSDGWTDQQDLSLQTKQERSHTMIKDGTISLDPPLRLKNVASTLFTIPMLFQRKSSNKNNFKKKGWLYHTIWKEYVSAWVEKCLACIEEKCPIHLSKIQCTPFFSSSKESSSCHHHHHHHRPKCSLAFSGHVLLFQKLPIPFIHVTLPSFILPHLNGLLSQLLSDHPIATSDLLLTPSQQKDILLALLNSIDTFSLSTQAVFIPPSLSIHWTLPGGLTVVMDTSTTSSSTTQKNNKNASSGSNHSMTHSMSNTSLTSLRSNHHHHPHHHYNNTNNTANKPTTTTTTTTKVPMGVSVVENHIGGDDRNNNNNNNHGNACLEPHYFIPWSMQCTMKGRLDASSVHASLTEFTMIQREDSNHNHHNDSTSSRVSLSGNIQFHKPQMNHHHHHPGVVVSSMSPNKNTTTPTQTTIHTNISSTAPTSSTTITTNNTNTHHHLDVEDAPSVLSVLLSSFLSSSSSSSNKMSSRSIQKIYNLLQYDYSLDIDTMELDTLSVTMGAYHPMLKGGTSITTVLESMYLYGSLAARAGAIMDMNEIRRKRNILRHLPAIDVSIGIPKFYIPIDSNSYSDDGQTKCLPTLDGGRMMFRILGGITSPSTTSTNNIESTTTTTTTTSSHTSHPYDDVQSITAAAAAAAVAASSFTTLSSNSVDNHNIMDDSTSIEEGIKVIVDFGVASFSLLNEGHVNEFPELDIFEEDKLHSLLAGNLNGRIACLLRPLSALATASGIGRNIFNPLEAYEIVFSGSHVSLCMKEATATLGHRRLILPTESKFNIFIDESIVDMSFDGKTQCEVHWDFQGSSPIFQVSTTGLRQSPAHVPHEDRKQVALLISSLRQGRFNLNVSSVGGITITKAKTSRENCEGLYDWKFFNAIVSPDEDSPERIYQVLHDKRSMNKLLQVIDLLNADLGKLMKYILKQVWRAKEILDQEGVSDPGQVIPGHKMARLVSLFLCNDDREVNNILPIIQRIVAGDGLDVVKTKELLRKNLSIYEDWAPEIDRAVRWAEVMLGPMEAAKPYVENEVPPLSELRHYEQVLYGIPSANEIYTALLDKPQLPLDESFSSLVGELAPYLTFNQIEYILRVRPSNHWQPLDLRRLRYVYAIKRKVLEISESYGGISFLPQSFFVSVFVGEASRASLRVTKKNISKSRNGNNNMDAAATVVSGDSKNIYTYKKSTVVGHPSTLRQRRIPSPTAKLNQYHHHHTFQPELQFVAEDTAKNFLSPAGRIASVKDFRANNSKVSSQFSHHNDNHFRLDHPNSDAYSDMSFESEVHDGDSYELGDSLLGPQDVAILLQAGLTSPMKNSTVVQLNQRMLLDLMASQPKSFALAVLSEIGTPGVLQSSPRAMTSALMALLDLDQSSFREFHRLDMHALLESWLPGLKIPRREDYLAGGRWARQSYYNAIFGVAKNILEDAECYIALKGKVQRVRQNKETDPIPQETTFIDSDDSDELNHEINVPLRNAVEKAKRLIMEADETATAVVNDIKKSSRKTIKHQGAYAHAVELYNEAFAACAEVLKLDKLSFQADWFKRFYRRNYDALMVKSIYDNVQEDVDDVRAWLDKMTLGIKRNEKRTMGDDMNPILSFLLPREESTSIKSICFSELQKYSEQELIDGIIDVIFYEKCERESIRKDPLVRLLISNPPGHYNLTIVSAMGVITEGQRGLELDAAFARLEEKRGVSLIRSDTGTARSLEYNASKIEEAIEKAILLGKPYGLLGYSQGCANALTAESSLLSGTPLQQRSLMSKNGLVCRQLLFSAANGSMHGPAMDAKANRLIMMCEEFFKYQQGYCSKAFITTVLEMLTNVMDSPSFQKFVCGGGGTFLHEGNKMFWREAQHLPHVPTCVLRGVLEKHTTPESLEMISNLLTKQAGSALHDSQVHVFDAVGYPVYTQNRNGKILKNCDMGGAIQRTHHWSPLSDEVDFVKTKRDEELGSFICAKDRHVFPWVDVNARFGIVEYTTNETKSEVIS